MLRYKLIFFTVLALLIIDSTSGEEVDIFNLKEEPTKFLSPDQAFNFTVLVNNGVVEFNWEIAKGYYLYREKFSLTSDELPEGSTELRFPAGELYEDAEFGEVEIYRRDFQAILTLGNINYLPDRLNFSVGYQGCAEAGLCYPPASENVSVRLGETLISNNSRLFDGPVNVNSSSFYTLVLSFMGLGLLLSITPCVFPMLPILSGIIVGGQKEINPYRAFCLSSVYVIAMAVAYSILGLLIGLLGRGLQVYLQHPATILFMATIFIFLGLSMFGLYEIEIPAVLRRRFEFISRKAIPNTIKGVATMGAISALIATPCVTPPLAAVLTYVGDSGSPTKGALALFSLGVGMGLPLIVFGTSLSVFIPRSGRWMELSRIILGFVLFSFAAWFLERILSDFFSAIVWLVVGFSLVIYIFLNSTRWLGYLRSNSQRKAAYISFGGILVAAVTFFVSQAVYDAKLLRLVGYKAPPASFSYQSVDNLTELQSTMMSVRKSNLPIMIEFYADWCVECKRMEAKTFNDEKVQRLLQEFSIVRIDLTKNTAAHQTVLEHFNLFGPPAMLFFTSSSANEFQREIGFLDEEEFQTVLVTVLEVSE